MIEGSPTDAPKPDISQVIDNEGQEEEKQAGNQDQFEVPHEPPGTAQNSLYSVSQKKSLHIFRYVPPDFVTRGHRSIFGCFFVGDS